MTHTLSSYGIALFFAGAGLGLLLALAGLAVFAYCLARDLRLEIPGAGLLDWTDRWQKAKLALWVDYRAVPTCWLKEEHDDY